MRFLFSPYGRTDRKGYWLFILIYVGFMALSMAADRSLGFYDAQNDIGLFESVIGIFFIWPTVAVAVRRLHDLGYSGWWILWVILISLALATATIAAFIFSGIDGISIEAITALDENAQMQDIPPAILIVIGIAAIPGLIQSFMLLFVPGQSGENRYDHAHEPVAIAPPPWAD